MGISDDIKKSAKRVYETLGAGHEEAVYRDAMSVELQEMGYVVKTERPVEIKYTTSKGKEITIGSGKIDIYVESNNENAVVELKTVSSILKKGEFEPNSSKEYAQLQKYLKSLGKQKGFLINFPFPPKDEPEIVEV